MRVPSRGTCWGNRFATLAARRRPADVEFGQRGQVQRVEQRPRRREPRAGRVPGAIRIEGPVVVHDGHAVPGHAEVELQHVHTQFDGALERRHRVLRKQSAGAAVSLDFERVGGHEAESEREHEEHDASQEPKCESVRPGCDIR